jgi:sulfite reductase beta subunit-like hemoprotein
MHPFMEIGDAHSMPVSAVLTGINHAVPFAKIVTLAELTYTVVPLSSDMNHTNVYAVGLALCTFANIASEQMSRDLANEIEKLLGSSNIYIRKKVHPTPVSLKFTPLTLDARLRCVPYGF